MPVSKLRISSFQAGFTAANRKLLPNCRPYSFLFYFCRSNENIYSKYQLVVVYNAHCEQLNYLHITYTG